MIRSSLLALLVAGLACCQSTPARKSIQILSVHDHFELTVEGRVTAKVEPMAVHEIELGRAKPEDGPSQRRSGPSDLETSDRTVNIRVHMFSVPEERVRRILRRPLQVDVETAGGPDLPVLTEIPLLNKLARTGLPVELRAGAQGWHAAVDRAEGTIKDLERAGFEFQHFATSCDLNRTANLATTDSVSFVESFGFEEQHGVMVADPVIGTTQNGIALELSPQANPAGSLQLDFQVQIRELSRPLASATVGLPGSALPVALHTPVYVEQVIRAKLEGSEHDMFVLCAKDFFHEGHTIVTFVEAQRAEF